LNKLPGIPYLDAGVPSDIMLNKLADAISRFHAITKTKDTVLCHWDNQPGNILWDEVGQQIYLLDFEDIRPGFPEADLIHLMLFWAEALNHEDFVNRTKLFINLYQSAVPLKAECWKNECRKAKVRFDARRKKYNKRERLENPSRKLNRKYLSSGALIK
jgi:thiamine kinase-like enzyme